MCQMKWFFFWFHFDFPEIPWFKNKILTSLGSFLGGGVLEYIWKKLWRTTIVKRIMCTVKSPVLRNVVVCKHHRNQCQHKCVTVSPECFLPPLVGYVLYSKHCCRHDCTFGSLSLIVLYPIYTTCSTCSLSTYILYKWWSLSSIIPILEDVGRTCPFAFP